MHCTRMMGRARRNIRTGQASDADEKDQDKRTKKWQVTDSKAQAMRSKKKTRQT